MVDVVDSATRSRMMSGIRGKNTHPEMVVRKFLHKHGFRFRLHSKNLPGRPDIVLSKWMVVIFVHGCFWHRHKGCRYSTMPKSNAARWLEKFEGNVARDKKNQLELVKEGWKVIVLWECGLKAFEAGKESLLWLLDFIEFENKTGVVLDWPLLEVK